MPFAAVAAGIGAGTSILGGVLGKNASKQAASVETNAANNVATEAKAAGTTATQQVADATTGANQVLTAGQNQQLQNLAPYQAAGTAALNPLAADIAGETNAANQFSFSPQQFQQDPEYAFIMQQQQQALQRSAAAQGGLLTGGTIKATQQLANNLTSTDYGQAFNQALQSYTTNRQNTLNQIAGYQNLVGTGLSSTNTANTDIGNTAAQVGRNLVGSGEFAGQTTLGTANTIANAQENAANATAAGITGGAKSVNSALGGVGNAVTQGYLLSKYPGSGNGGLVNSGNGVGYGPSLVQLGVGSGGTPTGNSLIET